MVQGPVMDEHKETPCRDGFKFEKMEFSTEGIEEMQPFFDRLPADPYIAGRAYRLRRLSAVHGPLDALVSERTVLKQGYENNMFANVPRSFPPLEEEMINLPVFRAIVACYRAAAHLGEDALIDVHAIRTVAESGAPADPAPEGIHRDGRRLVGIFSIARNRVSGAVTMLHSKIEGDAEGCELFKGPLMPGHGVLVNDRLGEGCYHYTGPIEAIEPPLNGTRDVVVLLV